MMSIPTLSLATGGAIPQERIVYTAFSALDQHRRFNDPGVFCARVFHTFFPIHE